MNKCIFFIIERQSEHNNTAMGQIVTVTIRMVSTNFFILQNNNNRQDYYTVGNILGTEEEQQQGTSQFSSLEWHQQQ